MYQHIAKKVGDDKGDIHVCMFFVFVQYWFISNETYMYNVHIFVIYFLPRLYHEVKCVV